MLQGVAGSLEHAAVLRSLPRAKTILDIGANKGQFVLEAIKWHPEATMLAFEPLGTERALMERVLKDLPRLTIYPIALGSDDSTAEIQVSASADSSSILEQTPLQSKFFPGTQGVGRASISVRRIDHVLDRAALTRPVICKIDVQGYELNVLQGFGDLLDEVDYLIIELTNIPFYEGAPNSAEVIAFLAARGFKIDGMYNMYVPGTLCLQSDILFSRIGEK
ncbi:MAG TPA: FkbM family methyltransferase [Bradyrhizobium sp.]|nr:FkbM family methyltransferase [Bradyrhizobium sp.]